MAAGPQGVCTAHSHPLHGCAILHAVGGKGKPSYYWNSGYSLRGYPGVPPMDPKRYPGTATLKTTAPDGTTVAKTPPGINYHVQYLDYLMGELIRHAESLGIGEKFVLIFTTDNGTTQYGKGQKGDLKEQIELIDGVLDRIPIPKLSGKMFDRHIKQKGGGLKRLHDVEVKKKLAPRADIPPIGWATLKLDLAKIAELKGDAGAAQALYQEILRVKPGRARAKRVLKRIQDYAKDNLERLR